MIETSAIVVDRDGVLTDFDMAAAAAYFAELLPISLQEMWERWEVWGAAVGFPCNLADEARFFRGYWDSLADEFALDAKERSSLRTFDYTEHLIVFPDVRPALVHARQMGLKIGVLSNFTLASLEPSLETTRLSDLVDAACAATVIGASKPQPEAYLTAARLLGVPAEECLFFDDELSCVEGARRAGMTAYLVDRSLDRHDLSRGVARDLSAITRLIEGVPA